MKDKPVEGFSQRDLLSVVFSLSDPLGLMSPFTIRIRNVLNNFWKSESVERDKTIAEKIAEEYESWRKELTQIKTLKSIDITSISFQQRLISMCSLMLHLKDLRGCLLLCIKAK